MVCLGKECPGREVLREGLRFMISSWVKGQSDPRVACGTFSAIVCVLILMVLSSFVSPFQLFPKGKRNNATKPR